jgi:hypothetical protein
MTIVAGLAVHAFTVKGGDRAGSSSSGYHAEADAKSWHHLTNIFLKRIFSK